MEKKSAGGAIWIIAGSAINSNALSAGVDKKEREKMKKTWKPREFRRMLESNGYVYDRCKGDHMTYRSPEGRTITFSVVGEMNRMLCRRLIREYGLVAA